MSNFAALRAAVFPLSTKNFRGGGRLSAPPVGARVKHVGLGEASQSMLRSSINYHSLALDRHLAYLRTVAKL